MLASFVHKLFKTYFLSLLFHYCDIGILSIVIRHLRNISYLYIPSDLLKKCKL